MVVLLFTPLRILHPTLRKLGMSNGDLPVDCIARWYCEMVLTMVGIEVRLEGTEHLAASRACTQDGGVCMFSHASNLDPFILGAVQPFACKFVGKKVLFYMPLIGWMA